MSTLTEPQAVALGQLRVGQENLTLLKIEQPLSQWHYQTAIK
jgi:hypothetical protein